MACCTEPGCTRKQLIKIRYDVLTDRWVAITHWSHEEGNRVYAHSKHDVTDDLVAALIAEGWTPPTKRTS
jgi:hypothetical protein